MPPPKIENAYSTMPPRKVTNADDLANSQTPLLRKNSTAQETLTQVEVVKEIMHDNMLKSLEKSQHLDITRRSSEDLLEDRYNITQLSTNVMSKQFRKASMDIKSKKSRNKFCCCISMGL